jgi:transcriptional regulator of aromatic amino acid metabolism
MTFGQRLPRLCTPSPLGQLRFGILRKLRFGITDCYNIDACLIIKRSLNQEKTFREDLDYRLKEIHIQTPSLRDVPEGIPVLVNHFLPNYCKAMNTDLKQFTPEALACLENTTGPETREQLENDLKRLVAQYQGKHKRGSSRYVD